MPRRRLAAALLSLLPLAAACGGPPADAPLTDPREILARTIAATGEVRTAHLRLELEVLPGGQDADRPDLFGIPLDFGPPTLDPNGGGLVDPDVDPGFEVPEPQPVSAVLEADLDLANEAYRLSFESTDDLFGEMGLILIGDSLFVSDQAGGWMEMSADLAEMGMAPLGAAPPEVDPAALVDGLLTAGGATIELRGVVECATGRCYHVRATIPPASLAAAYMRLLGMDGFMQPEDLVPAEAGIPDLPFDIYTDAASHRLVEAGLGMTVQDGTRVSLRLVVSAVDAPVTIAPPPNAVPMPTFDEEVLEEIGEDVGEGVPAPSP